MATLSKQQTSTRSVPRKQRPILDAFPDRIDLRDWFYEPTLAPIPDQLVNCHLVPEVLDQGQEGACTGFALAAVINFLLAKRGKKHGVSPRMLYELARRYDEWPGEDYEGSSARGAMKAWVKHGVCRRTTWPDDLHGPGHLSDKMATEALYAPGGAYYRVRHRQVRDMHAALHETGILYVTLMVHNGWTDPGPTKVKVECQVAGKKKRLSLPVISRKGRADGGHAIAIVGYTEEGFIIQNSWGPDWGMRGFALLPYEDYLLHATDVWVAQLGVPLSMDLWVSGEAADTASGLFRASQSIPLADIRPYVIDVANNGELSDSGEYWTTEKDLTRLFCETIPEKTRIWQKRRILLYLHGGLNSETESAKRIVAMRDVMLANEIYPLHIMWESDLWSCVEDMTKDLFTDADRLAGGFLDNVTEAKDRVLELTLAKPGGSVWGEMKENAQLASNHHVGKGAIQWVAKKVQEAKERLGATDQSGWELHIVGHSAGSIFAAYALPILIKLGVPLKTLQFMAPAIRCDLFKKLLLEGIKNSSYPTPSLYLLNDETEREDTVGPYGKSLLYLVSNALEGRRGVPLLGMKTYLDKDAELANLFNQKVNGRPALIVAGQSGTVNVEGRSSSTTHGGFDNDPDTMNTILYRILGNDPIRSFTKRDLAY